jgi:hypothetical protein
VVKSQTISWYELRVTVPSDAEVTQNPSRVASVASLKIYGRDVSEATGSTFSFSATRVALVSPLSLEEWSDGIIDAAAHRRVRVLRRLGDQDVIFAIPKVEEPIGTFVFAVIDGHGYNIMTSAGADSTSQAEIAEIVESIRFESVSDPKPKLRGR